MNDLSLFLFNVLIFTNKYAPFSLAGLVQGRVELNVGLLVPAQDTLRGRKKSSYVNSRAIKALPPTLEVNGSRNFYFWFSKKKSFSSRPAHYPPPPS